MLSQSQSQGLKGGTRSGREGEKWEGGGDVGGGRGRYLTTTSHYTHGAFLRMEIEEISMGFATDVFNSWCIGVAVEEGKVCRCDSERG